MGGRVGFGFRVRITGDGTLLGVGLSTEHLQRRYYFRTDVHVARPTRRAMSFERNTTVFMHDMQGNKHSGAGEQSPKVFEKQEDRQDNAREGEDESTLSMPQVHNGYRLLTTLYGECSCRELWHGRISLCRVERLSVFHVRLILSVSDLRHAMLTQSPRKETRASFPLSRRSAVSGPKDHP